MRWTMQLTSSFQTFASRYERGALKAILSKRLSSTTFLSITFF
jgi:hypothetical protein